jgi:hypothetical protein
MGAKLLLDPLVTDPAHGVVVDGELADGQSVLGHGASRGRHGQGKRDG